MVSIGANSSLTRSFMRVAVNDLSRLGKITNIMARHGFREVVVRAGLSLGPKSTEDEEQSSVDFKNRPHEAAQRFRHMLEELGPTFVKVGQILSTRRDLLPAVFIEELVHLQDSVPPLDFSEVKRAVEEGLGGKLEELFEFFDENVLASASIAETHLARLLDGTEVVVKVQRPGIEETIRGDLDLLFLFAKFLELTIAEMELYAPGEVVNALDQGLSMELDFFNEAANLEQFAENFKDCPFVRIPKLFRSHSSRTVMTMEQMKGRKIGDLDGASDEGREYAEKFTELLYLMIFEHGFFHADPHPGNCFLTDEGEIALIDFGLCGFLTPTQQDQLVTLIVSVVTGDVDGIARILLRMGTPLGHINMAEFKSEVSITRDRYIRRSLNNIDVAKFSEECIDAMQRYRVRMATEYALLAKTGATIEGIIRTLEPDYNILAAGQMYARRMLTQRYSSPRLMQEAFSGLMSLSYFLREVPDQLSQILMDAEGGTLKIKLDDSEFKELGSQLNTQTTRLFMGMCCAALTIATPLFFHKEPFYYGKIPVVTVTCGVMASLLCWFGLGWHVFGGRVKKLRLSPFINFFRRF